MPTKERPSREQADDARKDSRRIHDVDGVHNQIAQSPVSPEDLAHHGADHRQRPGHFETGEDLGKGERKLEVSNFCQRENSKSPSISFHLRLQRQEP